MQGIKNLTHGPINRQLFNLAMPIMATSFIQMAYSLTDMAWVGRLGSEAVAAIGSVGILTWMSGSISLLNKVGSEVSVGQSIGAQNQEDARHFASHNITIALIISLCWGGLLFILAEPIICIYELEVHITANAIEYLRIISTGMPFIFLSAAFTGIYNAAGRSKIPFYISGAGLLLNIILDPLFIFGFGLETNGAAYATWISQATVFSIFIYQLRFRKDSLLGGFPFFTQLKKRYTRRILKLGLPVATLNTLFAFVNMFLCRTASEQGGHIGLMTFTTGGQIEAITWNTSQGFSTALSAFIAQNYGARKKGRIRKGYSLSFRVLTIWGLFVTAAFVFLPEPIARLFFHEKEALDTAVNYLVIIGFSEVFMSIELMTVGALSGLGRTRLSSTISVILTGSRIPLALILTHAGMGLNGVWWALTISSIVKGIVFTLTFRHISRRLPEKV